MIQQDIYIRKFKWQLSVYYNVTCNDAKNIISALNFLKISESLKKEIGDVLEGCKENIGFTYSNCDMRNSIIVIGNTSSFDEFLNSLSHENMHLCMHIMETDDISPYGETPCYLIGELTQCEADIIKKFIC